MAILVISQIADAHSRAVINELRSHRCRVELLDLSEFPKQLTLSMRFRNGQHAFRLDRRGYEGLDLGDVRAVWWRRPQVFQVPASVVDPRHQRLALSESTTAFCGLYQSMGAMWINPPLRDTAAGHKPWQLTVAQEVGLEIPETLMTNDPGAARAFWDSCADDVVYKQFLALPEAWSATRRLRPEDKQLADSICVCPVIFQRRIDAVADLRVTIVGEEIFAASVPVDDPLCDVDVRFNPAAKYTAHCLPDDLTQSLHGLMRRLDLTYGAIDLRLTKDGRYVFLEINPAGQFLYVEEQTRQPITATLADRLAKA